MRKHLVAFFSALSLFFIFAQTNTFAGDVVITSSPTFFVTAGNQYSYHVTATSAKGMPIQFSFPSLPSWLTFNTSNNSLQGNTTAVGRYTVTIVANNSNGDTDSQSYYLYVTSPTPTSTPTQQPVPTTTLTPTITISPTTTSTPTPTPSNTGSTGQEQRIEISNLQPKDGSTVQTLSPQISGKIVSGFPLDKKSFNIFFDNTDVTQQASLDTAKTDDTHYTNDFSYQTNNIAEGRHTVNITITNSEGITIPESWAFTVEKPGTNKVTKSISDAWDYLLHNRIGNAIIILGLLLFIVIIARLIRRSSQKPAPPVS